MTEEMQKRIEEAIGQHFPDSYCSCSDPSDGPCSYCYSIFDFQAGAKFILEMPELRSALEFYAGNYLDGCKCSHEITCYLCRDYESLKKAGLCE